MAYFRCSGKPMPLIFGDGSDDDGTGTVTLATATWNAGTVDTGVIEKQYKNLIIPSNAIITAGNRNGGMIIRCQGDCTIHGTIRNLLAAKSLIADSTELAALEALYPSWMVNNGLGGSGGNGGGGWNTSGGTAQGGRFYGGGYGAGGGGSRASAMIGSLTYYGEGGDGGDTTGLDVSTGLFVNGAGSSCSAQYTIGSSNYHGEADGSDGSYGGGGGAGCASVNGYQSGASATGGAGNENGTASSNNYGRGAGSGGGGQGNYGGGVILLFVRGKLTIDGELDCYGSDGHNGGTGNKAGSTISYAHAEQGGGGGAGGGGRIYLMSRDTMDITDGTFNVSGGDGGTGYTNGSDGGNGTKHYIMYADFNGGAGVPTAIAS